MQGNITRKGNADSQNKAMGRCMVKVTPANTANREMMTVVALLGFGRYIHVAGLQHTQGGSSTVVFY